MYAHIYVYRIWVVLYIYTQTNVLMQTNKCTLTYTYIVSGHVQEQRIRAERLALLGGVRRKSKNDELQGLMAVLTVIDTLSDD